jgi:very-short-patch-repair endonuclease
METRLRLLLLKARLPRPCVQVDLHDASRRFLGRADLYYPDCRLVIEYDGENHRDRLAPDLRRQNALLNAGYQLLRFTAGDLRDPGSVAAQVRKARARLKHPSS